MNTYELRFPRYNSQRYGKPWGARVSFKDNRPQYDFTGHWDGEAVVIDAEIGDVLAFGQKDHRGSKSFKQFYVAEPDGKLVEVTEAQAREHWKKSLANSA